MTKTVTFKGQKHDVRGDEGSRYITVEVDRREYALYLKALTEIGVEWEYDPELPTDGHYIDDDGDIWFFKNGEGKYWSKDHNKWQPLRVIDHLIFTKIEPWG